MAFDEQQFQRFVAAQQGVEGFPSDPAMQRKLYGEAVLARAAQQRDQGAEPEQPAAGIPGAASVNAFLSAARKSHPLTYVASGIRRANDAVASRLANPGTYADIAIRAIPESIANLADIINPVPGNIQQGMELGASMATAAKTRGLSLPIQLGASLLAPQVAGRVGGMAQGEYDEVGGGLSSVVNTLPVLARGGKRYMNPSGYNQAKDLREMSRYLEEASEGRIRPEPTVEGLSRARAGFGPESIGATTENFVKKLYQRAIDLAKGPSPIQGAGNLTFDVPAAQSRFGGTPGNPGRPEPMSLKEALDFISSPQTPAHVKREALESVRDQLTAQGYPNVAGLIDRARSSYFKGKSAERTIQAEGAIDNKLNMREIQRRFAEQVDEGDVPPDLRNLARETIRRGDKGWHSTDKPLGNVPHGALPRVGLGDRMGSGFLSTDSLIQMLMHPSRILPKHVGAQVPVTVGKTPTRAAIRAGINQLILQGVINPSPEE